MLQGWFFVYTFVTSGLIYVSAMGSDLLIFWLFSNNLVREAQATN